MSITSLSLSIPITLISENNAREAWQARSTRRKGQRHTVYVYLLKMYGAKCLVVGPWHVTITRVAPRSLDDDNLSGSAKAVRDEIAKWMGFDDSKKSPITWGYAQRKGSKPGEYACEIVIATRKEQS